MKRFLKKVLIILIITSVIISIFYSYLLQIKLEVKTQIVGLEKIDSAQILILGDSRADRQLNPRIIHSETNLDVLNIAESSLDLYSLSLRLREMDLKNKTLVISASSWQINDGATDEGYFRIEAFNNLSAKQKILLYLDNPIELKIMLNSIVFSKFELTIGNNGRFINNNFNNITCTKFSYKNMSRNHPWYRNIKTNGIKLQLLKDALIELNKLQCNHIIIYNAPAYSEFVKEAKNNGVWHMENQYSETISNFIISEKLNNITFLDLRELPGFTQNDYYDPQHLCENGANKFTLKLIPILNNVLNFSKSNQTYQGSN